MTCPPKRARIRDLRKKIARERGSDNENVLLSSEDRDMLATAKMYSRALGAASKEPKYKEGQKAMVKYQRMINRDTRLIHALHSLIKDRGSIHDAPMSVAVFDQAMMRLRGTVAYLQRGRAT